MIPREQHTEKPSECQHHTIQQLAEECDNEYYMSALGPEFGQDEKRAKRGRDRILGRIKRFRLLEREVTCQACIDEIARQIELQEQGIDEIERIWQFR